MSTTKFYIYSIILSLILLSSCNSKSGKKQESNFTIKVKLENVEDGTKVLLKKQESNTTITIDSTTAKNGIFEFKGYTETPAMYGIFIENTKGRILSLVESGTVTITADKNSLQNAVITGSKLNDELKKFKEGSEKIVNKINDLFIQIQKARSENDLEKINEISDKMRAINDENTRYSLDYAKNNSESFVSSIVLQSLLRIPDVDIKEVESIYINFSKDVKKGEYAKNIYNHIQSYTNKKDSIN